MEWLTTPEAWIALFTLTVLEIVLGIDNIIFISILSGKLPEAQQGRARSLGLALAMFMRIALLFSLSFIISLTQPLFGLLGQEISGRDLILLAGGLFLLGKATHEIHQKLEGEKGHASARIPPAFSAVIFQIMLLDIVFSLDSVITAVGMAEHLPVMVIAILVAGFIMIVSAEGVSLLVSRHPTVKMLALSFLLLIGMSSWPTAWASTSRRATSTSRWASRSSSRRSTCDRGHTVSRWRSGARRWREAGARPRAAERPRTSHTQGNAAQSPRTPASPSGETSKYSHIPRAVCPGT